MKTAEEILDKYNLHWTYHPYDNPTTKLHDKNCTFCDIEDNVIKAMEEYATQAIADHDAKVCEWKVDKAEGRSAIPGCNKLYEWAHIGGKDKYCRFCGCKIMRV